MHKKGVMRLEEETSLLSSCKLKKEKDGEEEYYRDPFHWEPRTRQGYR